MKRIIRSLVYGILAQAFFIYLLFMTHSSSFSQRLLWNVSLAVLLAGPMPQVGRGVDGGPIYEPTANHAAMAIVGLALGVAVYSALVYFALGLSAKRSR